MLIRRRDLSLLMMLVVTSSACHDPDKYDLLSPTSPDGTPASSWLDVVPQSATIPANGGSRTRIEARIDPAASIKRVTFETTGGTLYAGSKNSNTDPALEVAVDTNGVAAAELQSDAEPKTARVTVKVAVPNRTPAEFLSQSVDITFTPVDVGQMIALLATPAAAEADGATQIRLVATIAPEIPFANRTVTFTATNGSFATNTVNGNSKVASITADASHTATVDLVVPTVAGSIAVTATVSSFSARTNITVNRASPDVIFLELDKGSVLRVGEVASITVVLLRDVGRVAENTSVSYEARDSGGNRIGGFERVMLSKFDEAEQRTEATADFNPDDLALAGVATITATVGGRSGSATITLQ